MKLEVEVHVRHSTDPAGVESLRLDLAKLLIIGDAIMSKISEAVAIQKEAFARLETSLTGIGADITALTDKIAELQNSPGAVTPEDQALLDQATALAEALAERFAEVDALTGAAAPQATP